MSVLLRFRRRRFADLRQGVLDELTVGLSVDDLAEHLLRRLDYQPTHLCSDLLDRTISLGTNLGSGVLDDRFSISAGLGPAFFRLCRGVAMRTREDLASLNSCVIEHVPDLLLHADEALLGLGGG